VHGGEAVAGAHVRIKGKEEAAAGKAETAGRWERGGGEAGERVSNLLRAKSDIISPNNEIRWWKWV
jgi:hypothetical protein